MFSFHNLCISTRNSSHSFPSLSSSSSLYISLLFFHFYTSFSPFKFFHLFLDSKANLENGFCDYSNGKWVYDKRFIGWYTENCRFLDPGFQCRKNGRNDTGYLHWRWKPHGCDLLQYVVTHILSFFLCFSYSHRFL